MKGLAEVKGLTAKLPRIRARKARTYYGTECVTPYKEIQYPGDDGHSPERRMSNPYAGEDHVEIMKWFLHKVFYGELSNSCHSAVSSLCALGRHDNRKRAESLQILNRPIGLCWHA